jgi:glutamate dehydrogenase
VLLRELTDSVTDKVLHDNRSQSLAISLDVLRAGHGFEGFHGFMLALEQDGAMERGREGLPSLEVLTERRAHGHSMTRPELSVLLAWAKLTLKQALLDDGELDDPALNTYVASYFPDQALEVAGADALAAHRLRHEIIATELGNDLIDLMGASFIHRLTRDTGFSSAEVARAWFIASRLCGARELNRRLVPIQQGVDADVVYRWLLGLARVLERTTRWVLVNAPARGTAGAIIDEYGEGLRSLRARFADMVEGKDREVFEERVREMQELTGSDELATSLITLRFLDQLLEILRIGRESGHAPERAGRTYYLAGDLLDIPRLRVAVSNAAGGSRWDQRAAQMLSDELRRAHRRVVIAALAGGSDADEPEDLLARATTKHAAELSEYRRLLDDMATDDRPTFSALIIVVGALSAIAA